MVIFLASLVATLALGVAHLGAPADSPEFASGTQEDQALPSPALDGKARSEVVQDDGSDGEAWFLSWGWAAGSSFALVASFILLRVEIRREKDAQRARRSREEYTRELRRYNAQLRGHPRQNT